MQQEGCTSEARSIPTETTIATQNLDTTMQPVIIEDVIVDSFINNTSTNEVIPFTSKQFFNF